MSNIQQGMTRMMSDPASMYQEIARGCSMPGAARARRVSAPAPNTTTADADAATAAAM
jgi:hypothetical protein